MSKELQKIAKFYIFDKRNTVEVDIGTDIFYIAKKSYQKTKENCINLGYQVVCDNEYLLKE